ncbi:MAG: GEVED domain-containing protein, partial [Phormidesmis sp.]
PALAQLTAPGITIDNTAHGSFENPNNAGVEIEVDSNTVTLTILEVAGIAVSNEGVPTEAPASVTDAGPAQGDTVIGSDDVVYFEYRITNTGNDQTQFFIPGAPAGVTNAAFSATDNPIEIIEYNDGTGSPTAATTLSISVDAGGDTTGDIAASVAGAAFPNDGSIPVGGYIIVRVPVKANTNLAPGTNVTVVLGNTTAVDGQNAQLDNGGDLGTGNNVNTVDNADGTGITPGDFAGPPVFEREASSSQFAPIGAANVDYGDAPDAAASTAVGDYESAPGRGPSHVVSAAPTIFLGTGSPAVDTETTFGQDGSTEDNAVVVNDGMTTTSLHGETFVAGETYTWDVTTQGTGQLTIWVDFDGDGDFEDDGPLTPVSSTGGTESVTVQVPFGATGGATYARVRYSSQTGLTSTGAAPDGEVEDYAINIDAAAPALQLVKRVTRVGTTDFTTFVDDGVANNDDNSLNWPDPVAPATTYLEGAIAAPAEPGEEVDYTIYFLSDGNTPINNIKICDLIPPNTSYVADSLLINLGSANSGDESALTDASDAPGTDRGEKFADTLTPPAPCPTPGAGMDEGGVYVEVPGPAANATGPGTPTSSFGYIRFTVLVD